MDATDSHREFIARTRALARDIGDATPTAIEAQMALLDLAEIMERAEGFETSGTEIADAAVARALRLATDR